MITIMTESEGELSDITGNANNVSLGIGATG